ncbi:hypothetical protein [Roseburia hominis]|uniref:hypothetical protein n=1 Tax=Roseburia hominis TaxID=301301 RepID=UPI0026EBB0FE|nr:hypothetical protein [Roseburia hominis]MCI7523062.1 hypothetical protein [Roseburia hominis]
MENRFECLRYVDALETVSLRLGKLNNMINSLCLGMQQENLEQQAIDCVESIGYCVNDIRTIVLDRLQQIQDLQNNIDTKQ